MQMFSFLFLYLFSMFFLPEDNAAAAVELIAPGVISTEMGEYSPTYDAKRGELYFMRRTPGKFDYTIFQSTLVDGDWTKPQVVPFSGQFRDAGPYISPDGKTLYFDSMRPHPDLAKASINLWYAKRNENGWGDAQLLKTPSLNGADEPDTGVDEFGPAVDGKGNLYFYSFRKPYHGGARYLSSPKNYEDVILDQSIPDPSFKTFVSYLYVSADGNFAIMEGKSPNGRDTDLYCSCKKDGVWTKPKGIDEVNTNYSEGGASLTTDEKYLIFTSNRPANHPKAAYANLYKVEAKTIIKKCKE